MIYILISKVKRQDLGALSQEELCNVCFEPLIRTYKQRMADHTLENGSTIKEGFYNDLSEGQRSLFSFHVYYDHAIESLDEFYWWSAYFMAQPKIWYSIKSGLKYFGDDPMLQILERVESVLKKYNYPGSLDEINVTREDLALNQELLESIRSISYQFNEAAPTTIQNIGNYIRDNIKEFIVFED
ncbi:hypothetical protein RE628_11685 [Paenibacillus sp. D2_2]|uniref:hypothetical protein n=1 Tax=Paenibacillus sp. D2_2 TaxID=3073092 RepID=UPI002814FF01|nr:hypothetical protein [Paenibacillus sp. D2_2]WMT42884.1 hypothetical protein RE628_11685 [Paenibacillus sp. D2_2]